MASPEVMPLPVGELESPRLLRSGHSSLPTRPPAPRPFTPLLPLDEVANLPVDATVVIPTYNERENIATMIRSLESVLATLPYRTEILIVDDDSPDGTADVVRHLPTRVPTRVLVRHDEKGLASAVLAGISRAKGRACVVMDVDGSHPADMVPTLLETVLEGRAEMALASRYAPGGGTDDGWPQGRKVMSRIATWLARPLTAVHDPMTGYFAIDPKVLARSELSPIGYKIGLEILVRCEPSPVLEVPFVFRDRRAGRSKMSHGEVIRYARHLSRLYVDRLGRSEEARKRSSAAASAASAPSPAKPEPPTDPTPG